jgi:hypothetical protein
LRLCSALFPLITLLHGRVFAFLVQNQSLFQSSLKYVKHPYRISFHEDEETDKKQSLFQHRSCNDSCCNLLKFKTGLPPRNALARKFHSNKLTTSAGCGERKSQISVLHILRTVEMNLTKHTRNNNLVSIMSWNIYQHKNHPAFISYCV